MSGRGRDAERQLRVLEGDCAHGKALDRALADTQSATFDFETGPILLHYLDHLFRQMTNRFGANSAAGAEFREIAKPS